jgi:hypothetical protein
MNYIIYFQEDENEIDAKLGRGCNPLGVNLEDVEINNLDLCDEVKIKKLLIETFRLGTQIDTKTVHFSIVNDVLKKTIYSGIGIVDNGELKKIQLNKIINH